MNPRTIGAVVGSVVLVGTVIVLLVASEPLRTEDATEWAITLAFSVGFGLLLGAAAGLTTTYVTAATRGRDGAERLLGIATAGLGARRADWGDAMRAELAAIDDPAERRRFARGAAAAAFRQGLGFRMLIAGTAALVIAVVVFLSSRAQLEDGSPGVLAVSVPVPALILGLVALGVALATRSFRVGLETGLLAALCGFIALVVVLALEGVVWMQRHGVFILDGDPPNNPADGWTIALDVFTTGMWLGHVLFWVPVVVVGAAAGAVLSRRCAPVAAH